MFELKDLDDLKRIMNHLTRLATTQAAVALSRNYKELTDTEVVALKERVLAVYNRAWVGEDQERFWGETLKVVNRFWGEHYSHGDGVRQSIAFPIIAKLFTDAEIRNAWNAVVLACIERAGLGECAVWESVTTGHQLILVCENKHYLLTPGGIDEVDTTTLPGSNISHHFHNGWHFTEKVGADSYLAGAIEVGNYYYRSLALTAGLLFELDGELEGVCDQSDRTLELERKRQCAIEALLMARNENGNPCFAASGIGMAVGLLRTANFGENPLIKSLFVQSLPLNVPNHRFVIDHAVSELAHKLKARGYDVERHSYPELVGVVACLCVQILHSGPDHTNHPKVYWNEELCDSFVDLIYGLGKSTKVAIGVINDAKKYAPMLQDAAKILTVVYQNQIR